MKLQILMESDTKFPGFATNIEQDTIKNNYYRKVIYTAKESQLVLMSLLPGEEIGEEVHPDIDQFFRFEKGKGKVVLNGISRNVRDGSALVVPKGTKHNIINTSNTEELKLYTVYSPPHHNKNTIFKTKEEAEKSKEHFDGKTDV